MKTLYILGAGASANSVPVVREMGDSFLTIFETALEGNTLKNKMPTQLFSDLKELRKGIVEFGTPDIFAKMAHLSHDSKLYNRIKSSLSFYLILIHIINGIDKRYYSFISALLGLKTNTYQLKEDFYIATWNYDLQLASAFSKLTGMEVSKLNKKIDKFMDYYGDPISYPKNFFRLNGYAGSTVVNERNLISLDASAFDFIYVSVNLNPPIIELDFSLY